MTFKKLFEAKPDYRTIVFDAYFQGDKFTDLTKHPKKEIIRGFTTQIAIMRDDGYEFDEDNKKLVDGFDNWFQTGLSKNKKGWK